MPLLCNKGVKTMLFQRNMWFRYVVAQLIYRTYEICHREAVFIHFNVYYCGEHQEKLKLYGPGVNDYSPHARKTHDFGPLCSKFKNPK